MKNEIGNKAPLSIHIKIVIRLENGKKKDPITADAAIEAYSIEKSVKTWVGDIGRLPTIVLKIDNINAFHVKLFTTTIKAGVKSLQ
ncbi:MAG: hypothetical protein QXM65_07550 [Candidatus Bathyarchaeia archaeon]